MTVDINTYRSRIGLHYSLALRLKGIKYFTNFEFLLFVGTFLFRSGDIELNPGPNSNSSDNLNSSNTSTSDLEHDSLSDISPTLFQKYFSLVHYNVQRILQKVDSVELELNNFDVISLTETWLQQSNLDSDIKFQGYKSPFRHDRQADAHGGVAVYVKETFYSRRRDDLELRNVECVWVEILIKNKPV